METQPHEPATKSDRPILSKREMIVDILGHLDTAFAKMHLASQQLLNSAQNLREAKLQLNKCIEGKSYDDAPADVEFFHVATTELTQFLGTTLDSIEQFEAASDQLLLGANNLNK
jgi:cob(I)alamin adenosyltransferase